MVGIYKITNKINGKSYIGQSVDIKRRFMEHKTPHGQVTPIKLAIKKYGKENFSFEVLEECTPDALDEREIWWISELKPKYNRTTGGNGARGHFLSEEAKRNLSEKNKAYWANLPESKKTEICERLTGHAPGWHQSEEAKQKLRAANIGKKQSKETIEKRKQTFIEKKKNGYVQKNEGHKKKIVCVETNQVFDSVKEAAKYLHLTDGSCLSAVLKGRRKTCKGFHFEYVV